MLGILLIDLGQCYKSGDTALALLVALFIARKNLEAKSAF